MKLRVTTYEQDSAARAVFERALAEDAVLIEQGNAMLERELARTVRDVWPAQDRPVRETEFSI